MNQSQLLSKKMMKGALLALATFVCVQANALTVSPARLEVAGDPGKNVSGEFLIVNEQSFDQTFYTSVENFEAQGETGTPSFSGNSKEGLASWIHVPESVTVKKGERVKIPYNIVIPQGADAGGHFAAVFLTTVPPSARGSEVAIGSKVGMLVLLRVSGDIKEGGGVLSFLTGGDSNIYTNLPVSFAYRFSNTGNDRVNPLGKISIRNMFGSLSKEINANKNQGNVLPNSVRRFDTKWEGVGAAPLTASFFDNVMYQWDNFAFGKYTATLSLSFGTTGISESSVSFYIIPWQLLVVILVSLFALYVVLHILIKHHDKVIIEQIRKATKRVRRE